MKAGDAVIHPLKTQIDRLLAMGRPVTVAIDGPCAAGKTTLAAALAAEYDCNVFHMDDFFLRPEQRTPQRLAQVGGNVDYERFQAEILSALAEGIPFSYLPYDCKRCRFAPPVSVPVKRLNIIEGSYSLHPYFGEYCDLKIFLSVTPELQRQRILQRPAQLHDRFFREWIPMEQRYFAEFHISQGCDLVI